MTVPTVEDFDNATLDLQTVSEVGNNNFPNDTTTNRTSTILDTLQGRLKKLGYEPPIAYAPAISFTVSDNAKTIERSGLIYQPKASNLPFTTTGVWGGQDDDDFLLIVSTSLVLPLGVEMLRPLVGPGIQYSAQAIIGATASVSLDFEGINVTNISAILVAPSRFFITIDFSNGNNTSGAQFKATPLQPEYACEYQAINIVNNGGGDSITLVVDTLERDGGALVATSFKLEAFREVIVS